MEPAQVAQHIHLYWGKHKDVLISNVPADYLRWMVRNKRPQFNFAAIELERRMAAIGKGK